MTREEVIKKIQSNDVRFFQKLYFGNIDDIKYKEIWDINWGDGNEWIVALELTDYKITIVMEGYYSSHGDSEFDKVGFGVPFEFKETRYRIAKKDELRDLKIDELLTNE
jgi:hypothetical protein